MLRILPQIGYVISTGVSVSERSGEIPPVTFQIQSYRIIASPSYGEVAARESAQTERSKENNAPSVCNKLQTAPHSDGSRI